DDLEPAWIALCDGFQRGNGARVMLDGDDVRRPQRQQRTGQSARPRTDLDHGRVVQRTRGACNARGEVEVEQEILPQRFARRELMLADDFAERRQVVDFAHETCAGTDISAMRAASRSAAIRLAGLARPVPAMSKAVPWSGEVRMKGSPSVTLTPSSKAMVLIGISAWSWYMQIAQS